MAPGSTIEITKAEIGGPDDGASEVSIEIIPSKAKKREAVGVGAKGGDGGGDEPSGDAGGSLPDEPEVLPDVPDAPPADEGSKE
jgi:hypothetical protein